MMMIYRDLARLDCANSEMSQGHYRIRPKNIRRKYSLSIREPLLFQLEKQSEILILEIVSAFKLHVFLMEIILDGAINST